MAGDNDCIYYCFHSDGSGSDECFFLDVPGGGDLIESIELWSLEIPTVEQTITKPSLFVSGFRTNGNILDVVIPAENNRIVDVQLDGVITMEEDHGYDTPGLIFNIQDAEVVDNRRLLITLPAPTFLHRMPISIDTLVEAVGPDVLSWKDGRFRLTNTLPYTQLMDIQSDSILYDMGFDTGTFRLMTQLDAPSAPRTAWLPEASHLNPYWFASSPGLGVPAGAYTARSLAQELNTLLSPLLTVTFDTAFHISGTTEFILDLGITLAGQMGFSSSVLMGQSTYTSSLGIANRPADVFLTRTSDIIVASRPYPALPAHGFDVGQMVIFSPSNTQAVVTDVPSATSFVTDPPAPLGETANVAGPVVLSQDGCVLSAYIPSYIMMQIIDPAGSANVQHNAGQWCGAFIAKAKPGLYQCQCLWSSIFKFSWAIKLTKIHVRFLCPDASLYKLNGRPWSMTLKATRKTRC